MSFGRDLFRAFETHGDRVAILAGSEELTYKQLLDQVGFVAANLRAAGVGSGSYVGIALQDSVESLLAILACWRLAATVVTIDFRAPRIQRKSLAHDFNLAIVLESPGVPGDSEYPSAMFDREWRFSGARRDDLLPADFDVNPAFLLFTSGTTGKPKAYVQTHDVLAVRISTRRLLLDSGEMRFLTPMALTYSATRHQVFAYLMLGGTVQMFPPLFAPSELADALLAFRASGTALPPPVVARLVRQAGARSTPLFPDLLVLASVGGPAKADDKVAAYRNLSPGYRMGYASSLTGMIAVLSGPDVLKKPETTGRAAGGARIAILGADGSALPPGEAGRIKAWTPSIVPSIVCPVVECSSIRKPWVPIGAFPGISALSTPMVS